MQARSRQAIKRHILELTERHDHPFAFNVKVYETDLAFESLLGRWREYEGDPLYTHNPRWLKQAAERYQEHERHLFDWGVEGACSYFSDGPGSTYTMLWCGTAIDVEYGFTGRTGGWLYIARFEGHRLSDHYSDRDGWLQDLDWPTLKKFYQLVLMLSHDLSPERRRREVEHQAAFTFFANTCSDLITASEVQLDLFDDRATIERLAIAGEYPDDL